MPTTNKVEDNSWTLKTLFHYFETLLDERSQRYDERFQAQEKAVAAALASQKEAVVKAENAAEKRFEGLNELRGVVTDILAKTVPRFEAEAAAKSQNEKMEVTLSAWDRRHDELSSRLSLTEKRIDVASGEKVGARAVVDNSRANIALVISVILFAINLLQFMWNFAPRNSVVQEVIPAVKPANQ